MPFFKTISEKQAKGKVKKVFDDIKKKDLILLKIETLKLDNLVWEQASDGNMFPHLYAPLNISDVCNEYDIVLNKDGTHTLPSIY